MADDWTLNLNSGAPIGSWEEAAAVLHALIEAITRPVEQFYGQPLTWLCEPTDGQGWQDPAWIAQLLVSRRTRDDDGKVMRTLGAGGTVQGYLGDRTSLNDWMTSALYRVRDEPDSVHWKVRFSTRAGMAHPLDQHPDNWLVGLLAASASVARADEAVIYTTPLVNALADRDASPAVGAVTLAPHGIPPGPLPDSLRAYDVPGYPDGKIVIADLGRLEDEPDLMVDDLLVLDAALSG